MWRGSVSEQGSLAYIGSEKAIADLPFLNGNIATGGVATMLFWRSAYLSTLFSLRNRTLVVLDWLKVRITLSVSTAYAEWSILQIESCTGSRLWSGCLARMRRQVRTNSNK